MDKYYMCIDESGQSSLNHVSQYFVLSAIIIRKDDLPIIEGYLKLLKRKYFSDENKAIHTTDLVERPYRNYRKLLKPDNKLGKFMNRFADCLDQIPFEVKVYYIDKNKLRNKIKYIPAAKRKNAKYHHDLPYAMCGRQSIFDFTRFLVRNYADGEVIIESRMYSDSYFVKYFDDTRKSKLPGGEINNIAQEVRKRICAIKIANKRILNGGLEISDMCAYSIYRKLIGDPKNKMKINKCYIDRIYNIMRNKIETNKVGEPKLTEIKMQ